MGTPVTTKVFGGNADPDMVIRSRWSENLREAMRDRGVDKHELRARLDANGIKVTRQAIETWISGEYAPRPHVQQVIGTVLDYAPRLIFTLESAPRLAS